MTDKIDFGGRPWQAIPRDVLRDPRMSLKARGALVTLLSHEEGWVRSVIATIMREAHCGRDAAKAAMAELRELGYAQLVTEQDESGRMSRRYVIFTEPQNPEIRAPEPPGVQATGFQATVSQATGNQSKEVEALDVRTPDVEPLEVQELAPAPAVAVRRRSPNDDLWDALAEILGSSPTNRGEAGKWAKGISLLLESGVTPEEAVALCWAYHQRYDGEVDLNPMALAMHVSELRAQLSGVGYRPGITGADEWSALSAQLEEAGL